MDLPLFFLWNVDIRINLGPITIIRSSFHSVRQSQLKLSGEKWSELGIEFVIANAGLPGERETQASERGGKDQWPQIYVEMMGLEDKGILLLLKTVYFGV